MMRRMGRPGLLGTMARTAVVAGTASATVNAVNRHQAAGQQQAAEGPTVSSRVPRTPSSPPPSNASWAEVARCRTGCPR